MIKSDLRSDHIMSCNLAKNDPRSDHDLIYDHDLIFFDQIMPIPDYYNSIQAFHFLKINVVIPFLTRAYEVLFTRGYGNHS